MNINIKYSNLDSTAAIEKYVLDKIGSLEKLFQRLDSKNIPQVQVEIARTTKHHQKGPVFRAECNLELPGKLLRAVHEDWNIRRAIDEVKHQLREEINKYKEKVRPQDSRGEEKIRKLLGKE